MDISLVEFLLNNPKLMQECTWKPLGGDDGNPSRGLTRIIEPEEKEQWLPVVNYESLYEVSSLGRVRSVRNANTRHRGIVLKQPQNRGRYPQVTLKKGGKGKTLMVHQVVAHAFLGPQESGIEVRHLNGIKTDCQLSNLAYGTRSDNLKDQVRHGTHRFGKTHCVQGHEFTPENTYNNARCRICKTCADAANRRTYWAKKRK